MFQLVGVSCEARYQLKGILRAMMKSGLALSLLLVWLASFVTTQPEDKVAVLDVGQGDAILLQSGTAQALIDGGQGRVVLQRLAEEMPWFDRTIEVIMVTHPQRDHMEGLLHVLDTYAVSLVLLPEVPHSSQLQEAWLDELAARQIPYRFARGGQRLTLGEAELSILNPLSTLDARAATAADINNASIVVRATWPDLSFLLTGDAESRVERLLVETWAGGELKADILKVGHHGSKSSSSPEFLAAVQPQASIISAGLDNRFGHPHEDVLERLGSKPIWRTDRDGTVTAVRVDEHWLIGEERY